jgi:putative toxin-antitoxin system antitoxin component (TIGR02293 family)
MEPRSIDRNPIQKKAIINIVMASHSFVARIVPVVAHAVAVFGDEQKASHWLATPLPLFEGRAPSDLLDTDEGLELVEQTLIRIEHNVFS